MSEYEKQKAVIKRMVPEIYEESVFNADMIEEYMEEADKEITRLREALEFYADEKEYEERIIELPLDRDGHYATERTGKIILDRGGIAREALQEIPNEGD